MTQWKREMKDEVKHVAVGYMPNGGVRVWGRVGFRNEGG